MKEGANACKTLFVESFPGSAEQCSQQVSMNGSSSSFGTPRQFAPHAG
jgi:hypothetical protein